MKKIYKTFLNIIIIILVVGGIGIISYLAYDYINKIILTKEAEAAVDEFMRSIEQNAENNNIEDKNAIIVDIDEQNNINEQNVEESNNQTTTSETKTTNVYRSFNVVGSIQIPKTKIKYPIVDVITPDAVAVAVTKIYGPGLNEVRKHSTCCT